MESPESRVPSFLSMATISSVLEWILSSSPYLRSALGRWLFKQAQCTTTETLYRRQMRQLKYQWSFLTTVSSLFPLSISRKYIYIYHILLSQPIYPPREQGFWATRSYSYPDISRDEWIYCRRGWNNQRTLVGWSRTFRVYWRRRNLEGKKTF